MKRTLFASLLFASSVFAQSLPPAPVLAGPNVYCFDLLLSGEAVADQYVKTICLNAANMEAMVRAQGVPYVQALLDRMKAEAPPIVQPPPPPPPLPVFPAFTIGTVTAVDMDGKGGFIMTGYVTSTSPRVDIHQPPTGLTYAATPTVIPAAPTGSPKKWVWNIPNSLLDGKLHNLVFTTSYIQNQSWLYGEFDNASTAKPLPFQMPGPPLKLQ